MIFLVNQHARVFKRYAYLLVPYVLLRIGFYFYHFNLYAQFSPVEIFESFFMGLRFDMAAICLVNAPVAILSVLPVRNPIYIKLERLGFVLLNSLCLLSSLNDYELFHFMGKRLSFDLFVIGEDIWAQLPQIAWNYWYFPLASLFGGVMFYFFDKKFCKFASESSGLLRWSVSSVILLGLSFIGIRGGFQLKSITVQTAFAQGRNELGHLVLNTPYHFLRTLKNKRQERLDYFKDDEEAKRLILSRYKEELSYEGQKKANVVLIILESFALEYMEEGYTPFLSELKDKSLFFERHLANGKRSIECLPSLLCALPSLIDEPISKSIFQSNSFSCLPKVLKNSGYTNHFYHAGAKGTMGFETYTLAHGFDRYYSREDYPHKEDDDGAWGIFDGPYLKYVGQEMDKLTSPFFVGVFTLSSHQPYNIPEKYRGKFKKGELEIHESIGYSDHALKNFFDAIKERPWFMNTLFIITADHTQILNSSKYQNFIGDYRVPLLLYAPGHQWKKTDTLKVTQHSDIPVTVLDYVGIQAGDLPLLGRSVLSKEPGVAVNYASGSSYYLAQGESIITLDKNRKQMSYTYSWETGILAPVGESQDELLKAYMQYFINGLLKNNLSSYR